jgi:2-polyprenyl-3-methyl-5-hydroxy-6-metoxy-1,4-benzoquinol methylase
MEVDKTRVYFEVLEKPILGLSCYSVINDVFLLEEIKKSCYTQDVRASWIGHGLSLTHNKEFENWAIWALEHWAMYSGFLSRTENLRGRILDVGCGVGHATSCLASIFQNCDITGIDKDKECVDFANKYNTEPRVNYVQSDFMSFNSGDKFEYIFALEILEHLLPSLHYTFVDKCLSLLANNGLMFLTTPNALDEMDCERGHVGMLNRCRALAFFQRYKNCIIEGSFYDNIALKSMDPSKFMINDPIDTFELSDKNRSHFRLILKS